MGLKEYNALLLMTAFLSLCINTGLWAKSSMTKLWFGFEQSWMSVGFILLTFLHVTADETCMKPLTTFFFFSLKCFKAARQIKDRYSTNFLLLTIPNFFLKRKLRVVLLRSQCSGCSDSGFMQLTEV